jgi:hypothetical protein
VRVTVNNFDNPESVFFFLRIGVCFWESGKIRSKFKELSGHWLC